MAILLDNNTPPPARWKGLGTRIIGIIPLLATALICITIGGVMFSALVLLAAIIMLKEWDKLTEHQGTSLRLLGYPITIIPCACILWLRSLTLPTDANYGMKLIYILITIIAATDIGAYITGKRFGNRKLAPVISPNKTWEGLGGGVLGAVLVTMFTLPYALPFSFTSLFVVGFALAVLAQAGDILESWVKRRAGVKDSGSLIPGHGGLLDRVDGYLLTAPFFTLLAYYH